MTSPRAAAAHTDARAQALMTIGEVLAHLRPDFPDATISKLRFLEAEGLVEPRRTASGYRKYSWDDVARLRYVLTAQRDYYLPLKVIREQLAAIDAGADPALPGHARPPLALAGQGPAAAPATGHGTVTREELLTRSGLDERALVALEQHGLLRPRTGGGYDADAVTIATVAAELAGYGIEPRHLRAYRLAADREVGLFAQLLVPLARQPGPTGRSRAADTARELVTLSQRLHGALLRAALRETLGP